MKRLLIIAPDPLARRLAAELMRFGYTGNIPATETDLNAPADGVLVGGDTARREELCQRFKTERRLPVIVLFRKTDLTEKLSQNWDDFVLEPYDPTEINARLKRLLAARTLVETRREAAEDLVIDTSEAIVYLNGEPVELTFREYELLRYLAEHPGRVLSRDALLNAVWGFDYFGGDRTVDVHIRRLRSKIEDAGHVYIDTVRNMGYRFRKGENEAK
jgi:DNA-binding response OmpR family regulator